MVVSYPPYVIPKAAVLEGPGAAEAFEALRDEPPADFSALEREAREIEARILASKAAGTF